MADNGAVLFVDDEKNILNAIERLFHGEGMNILRADNADEAIKILKHEHVAVVVSDNQMPGTKGTDFLAKLRNISPDVIRILMTGQADLPTALDAINRGQVYRFIVKPWDDGDLIETVKQGLEQFNVVRALKKSDEATMLSLAQTIELKDKYTRGHCDRVADYSLMIADELALSETVKRDIRYGSWLHDCGKIGIAEAVLNKEGPLDDTEFEMIRNHPAWGADVAKRAQLSDVIINIILHHHEKCDGSGYPSGIMQKDIPVEARIVAVADVFDALTTNRSYRKAYPRDDAVKIIESMKESHLDPELVDIFLACINNISGHDGDCRKGNCNECYRI